MQWNCVWKPRMLLPSSPSSSSSRHGQIANASGLGHGMCQNVMIVASRQRARGSSAAAARNDSPARARSGRSASPRRPPRRRSAAFTRTYCVPVRRAERRPHVRDVAQRPQPLVGEAVVVAGLLLRREPDAAQPVRGRARAARRRGRAGPRRRGRRCRCRARSTCRSTRASSARAPSRGRSPGAARAMPSAACTWMYGSRFETTMTSLAPQLALEERRAASSGVQTSWSSSRGR